MAITQNTYTGNGSTVLYSFTFPYLSTSDIYVALNGTLTTAYTFANATTIQFNSAPANGVAIRIYRDTANTSLVAEFFPGSAIRAQDLNNDLTQGLYIAQESRNTADSATTTATSATTTANTALSNSSAAVSTANTASSNASAAVATANTASTNASNAVSTANAANSTSNTATSTAATALSTANSATTAATAATSTANTASSNASAAVSTANTASSNASAAVSTANAANSTANTASGNASTAVTTANNAVTTANTANSNSSAAVTTANAAAAAVANSVLYTTVANVAAIPASPANNAAVEVTNSTGIESFTPLSGLPAGFVGSSGLSVRIIYQTAGSTWTWIQYFPNDPENRYLGKAGGTMTGALVLSGAPTVGLNPTTKTYVDAADSTLTTAAAAAQSTANTANTTANAALPKTGGTMTGALVTPAGTVTANGIQVGTGTTYKPGIYSPGADQLAISTNGTQRCAIDSNGRLTLSNSEGIQLSPKVSSLYAVNGSLSYYATNNGVYLNGAGAGGYLQLQAAGTEPSRAAIILNGSTAATPDAITFQTSATERMRLDPSGRLGVGTSAAYGNSKLAIVPTTTPTTGTSTDIQLSIGEATANSSYSLKVGYINASGGYAGSIQAIGGGSAIQLFLNPSGGNVGIGTTSPAAKFEILNGHIRLSPNYRIGTGGTGDTPDQETIRFSSGSLDFLVGNTQRCAIDSSGRLLVGTSSSRSQGGLTAITQIEGTTSAGSSLSLINNFTGINGAYLFLGKSRAGVLSGNTAVVSNDVLGGIYFSGADGTSLNSTGASIETVVDGTPGANVMPGRIVFSTNSGVVNADPTERMRIDNLGYKTGTINGLGSGLYKAYQYYRLDAARSLTNATGVQSVLGVGVTLVGSTVYEFEGYFPLTKPSGATTSHTVSLLFGGTATINNINYDSMTTDSGSATGTLGTRIATINRNSVNAATAAVLTASILTATANAAIIRIHGTVSINAGGTLIPQVSFSAAPGGVYSVNIGSYFKIAPVSAAGANTSIGTWG